MNSLRRIIVVSVMCAFGASGCVAVNGGSVELAWTIRMNDNPKGCGDDDVHLGAVSLYVQDCDDGGFENCGGDATPATPAPVMTFDCFRGRGTTDFSISSGRKKMWISAQCADGSAADVTVPEPILRDVSKGEVTELNALLISVPSTGSACSP